jgi:hypothetical protein
MRTLIASIAFLFAASVSSGAAPKTWTGKISDSHCGAKHKTMDGKKMTDRECTEMCIKDGGQYVFVSQGKVYQIADQKDAALATHAGHTVRLTGEMKGSTITVSQIEMPKTSKK